MTLFKVEGQRIYIFKTPSQDHVPESHTSVIFLCFPLPGGSPAIPLVRADYQKQSVNSDKRNTMNLLPLNCGNVVEERLRDFSVLYLTSGGCCYPELRQSHF